MIDNKSLQEFLKSAGLYAGAVDGIIGPASRQAIDSALAQAGVQCAGWSQGRRQTAAEQLLLRAAGFDPGTIDGAHGPNTQAALERYEASKRAQAPEPALAGTGGDLPPPPADAQDGEPGRWKLMVLDLSHHNTVASAGFRQMRDFGIRGIIHKATQGTGYIDSAYLRRRSLALDAGLLWGAYHFADDSDPGRQVDHFLSAAQPGDQTLMALDWEPNGERTMSRDQARLFLEKLDAALGRPAVLYSGNLAREALGASPDAFFGGHPLWHAQYSSKYRVHSSWAKPWLWQYAERGEVPGVGGAVDHNSFDGDEARLAAEWASRIS